MLLNKPKIKISGTEDKKFIRINQSEIINSKIDLLKIPEA